jgi:hypothetical protein
MKKLFAAFVLASLCWSGTTLGQEYSEDPEDYLPAEEGLLDRSGISEEALRVGDQAHVILYNRPNFEGYSRQVWLRDGSRIDLHRCPRLHDNVRSMILVAPSHAAVVLLEKALVTYANQKHAVWWGKGLNLRWEINKRDLEGQMIFRQASALKFLYDGYWWSNQIQYIEC